MKTYELSYIISPEITLEEAEAKARELESAVSSREGTILKQLNPSARALSYQIKKRASGFWGVLEFQIEPEKLLEIEAIIQGPSGVPGKIVRHMVIIKKAQKPMKARRIRVKPEPIFEIEKKMAENKPASAKASAGKEKVELKDIEQQLDELLG